MAAPIPTNSNAAPVAGPGHDVKPFQEEMIWKALKTVRDPEIPVDIVNLGLVYAACSIGDRGWPAYRRAHVAHRARLQHV